MGLMTEHIQKLAKNFGKFAGLGGLRQGIIE
jgi:hypothetical protein